MMSDRINVFAPASVANVGCGYDVLGFALEGLGDFLTIERVRSKGLEIVEILGSTDIPKDPLKNVATVAGNALLQAFGTYTGGFRFKIKKMVKAGSGLGSSASSSSAAVFGLNELLGRPFSKTELVQFAGEGERVASGKVHYDNVAASIFGGFTLVRSSDPLDIVELNFPSELYVVIAHPQVEVKTSDAKRMLKDEVSLSNAITQWANLSGLTVGLLKGDFSLIGRSMSDVIAEPARSLLIPFYKEAKASALDAGALGSNIAGSGPSIFCLCEGEKVALQVRKALESVYAESSLEVHFHISTINPRGAEIVKDLK